MTLAEQAHEIATVRTVSTSSWSLERHEMVIAGMRAALQTAIDRGFDNDDAYNALRRLLAELEEAPP